MSKNPSHPSAVCLLSLFTLVSLVGCGGSSGPELGTVHGVVTLDGQPLPNATVKFQPTKGRASEAITDEQGNYTLRYTADENGAIPGEHTVIITTATEGRVEGGGEGDEGEWVEGQEETLPAKYNAQSELKRTVEAGDNNFDFELESE